MPAKVLSAAKHLLPERLEPRCMFSSAFTNVDLSHRPGNEAEGAIAIDRSNPLRLFALSNTDDDVPNLWAARSSDGGVTWTGNLTADEASGLPVACCDPSVSFDAFGNLFATYVNNDTNQTEVLLSTDGGAHFTAVKSLGSDTDQPTLTTGAGSVWLTFTDHGKLVATGAPVAGLGQVGTFNRLTAIPAAKGGTFGDIAIGADGQVAVTYQRGGGSKGQIGVNVDPDGLGPAPFGPAVVASKTGVKLFDLLPAQEDRGIDAEAGLAWDTSTGPFRGRLYLMYTDVALKTGSFHDRNNMDVFIRYSPNGGATWSNAIRVNDDPGSASQLLPRVALDQTTGDLAVTWHDGRNDTGTGSAVDTDGTANDDVTVYGALVRSTATGLLIGQNVQISQGATNASASENGVELGDYTGLDFHSGTLHPDWADNSNSTGDNPAGAHDTLDLFTATVPASSMPAPTRFGFGGLSVAGAPAVQWIATKGYPSVTKGKTFKFQVNYADADGLDASTITGAELTVRGVDGYSQAPIVLKSKRSRDGTGLLVTYQVTSPREVWHTSDSGVYTVTLNDGVVKDTSGNAAPGGEIGYFLVSVLH